MLINPAIIQEGALGGAGFYNGVISPVQIITFSDTGGSLGANTAQLHRCVVPFSGIIKDVAIYVVTQSGNVDVGVYDCSATRQRLWSSGSTACPAAGAWRVIGTANLAVEAGQMIELAYAVDNASTALMRSLYQSVAVSQLPDSFLMGGNTALPKLVGRASSAFPLPATIAEASLSAQQPVMAIIASLI